MIKQMIVSECKDCGFKEHFEGSDLAKAEEKVIKSKKWRMYGKDLICSHCKMNRDIFTLWGQMTPQVREVSISELKTEYKAINSDRSIKANWFYKGVVPKFKRAKVLEIFKRIIKEQSEELKKLAE